MGVKRKIRRKGNVVYMNERRGLVYVAGMHLLAGENDMDIDQLFISLVNLAVRGFITPLYEESCEGKGTLSFWVAEDLRDAKGMRDEAVKYAMGMEGDYEEYKELQEMIFGPLPEDLRDL